MENKKEIYIACVTYGEYIDYYEIDIFASEDKEKVEKWINRYNKIIVENCDRLNEISMDYPDADLSDYFWHDIIMCHRPRAIIKTCELR